MFDTEVRLQSEFSNKKKRTGLLMSFYRKDYRWTRKTKMAAGRSSEEEEEEEDLNHFIQIMVRKSKSAV